MNPEERPKFDENLGYETYSEGTKAFQARAKATENNTPNAKVNDANNSPPNPINNSSARRSR